MVAELVSEEELSRTKDMIKGRLAISLESSDDLANWYGRQTIYRKQYLSPDEYIKEIETISALDLKKMAKKIFVDNNLNLALIGSISSSLENRLKKVLTFNK